MNESGEGCRVLEEEGVWRNLEKFRGDSIRRIPLDYLDRTRNFVRIDGETPCRLEGRG